MDAGFLKSATKSKNTSKKARSCAYVRGMRGEAEGADRGDESGAGGVEAAESGQALIEWTNRSRPECSGWLRLRFGRRFAIMKLTEICEDKHDDRDQRKTDRLDS